MYVYMCVYILKAAIFYSERKSKSYKFTHKGKKTLKIQSTYQQRE